MSVFKKIFKRACSDARKGGCGVKQKDNITNHHGEGRASYAYTDFGRVVQR